MASKSPKLRWWVRIPLTLFGLALLTILIVAWFKQFAYNNVAARAKRQGLGLDVSVYPHGIPDNQNAAAVPNLINDHLFGLETPQPYLVTWKPVDFKTTKDFLAKYKASVQPALIASKLPLWAPKRDYVNGYSDISSSSAFDFYISYFCLQAELEWSQGHHEKSKESLMAAARLATLMSQEVGNSGFYAHASANDMVRETVVQIVLYDHASHQSVSLQESVTGILKPVDFHHMLATELPQRLLWADDLEDAWTWTPWIKRPPHGSVSTLSGLQPLIIGPEPFHFPTNIQALKSMLIVDYTNVDAAAKSHPGDPAKAYAAVMDTKPPTASAQSGEQYNFPSLDLDPREAARDAFSEPVRGQLLVVGTQILAYQREHGTLPKSLADLPKTVNITDPFTHSDFLYRPKGDRFIVWSPGPNLIEETHATIDDAQDNDDIVFQTIDLKKPVLEMPVWTNESVQSVI